MTNIQRIAAAVEASEGKTPLVVVRAFAPERVEILGRELHPITLGHCLALEKLEVPVLRQAVGSVDVLSIVIELLTVPSREALALSARSSEDELAMRAAISAGELSLMPAEDARAVAVAVHEHIAAAFETAIPLKSAHPSSMPRQDAGMGWWLSTFSAACSRWDTDTAMHEVPLAQVFAINAATACANGMVPSGKRYADHEFDRIYESLTPVED